MPEFVPNLYTRLGVSKEATPEEIKKAYRKMSVLHHPDKIRQDGGNDDDIAQATKNFTDIQQGYETLSDPSKRAEYDSGKSGAREPERLVVPPEMERPSANWLRTREALKAVYRVEGLELLTAEKRQQITNKTNLVNSPHFSKTYYKNIYCLTEVNDAGIESDKQFLDVFALIAEKTSRFSASIELPDFLTKKITPDIVLTLLAQFLKGKYYGETLIKIQEYIQAGSTNTDNLIHVNALYIAILKLISIQNLKLDYRQALDAFHDLYDAAFQEYRSIEGQLAIVEQLQTLAEKEYQDLVLNLNAVKQTIDTENLTCHTASIEVNRQTELCDMLVHKIQFVKEKIIVNADVEQNIAPEDAPYTLETELEHLIHQRDHCVALLSQAEETLAAARGAKLLAEETLQTITQALAPVNVRKERLAKNHNDLKSQEINPVFLQLIDSKYFKITLASVINHYWDDPEPHVTPANLAHMMAKVPSHIQNAKIKYNAFGTILQHADQRLAALSHESLSVQQYYDAADYLIDLSEAMPVVGLQALLAAGLCYQLVARRSEQVAEQMAAETMSLLLYQSALRAAAKMPPSLTLYATIQISRYLSELRFDQTTLTLEDHKKLVANRHDFNDKIPATKYEMLSVHKGTPLESIEGAIDRTFYNLSTFPFYNHPSNFLDQLPRQRCNIALMEGLIKQFSKTVAQEEQHEFLKSNGELAEQLYYRYENELTSKMPSKEKLAQFRLEAMNALLEQSNTSLFELSQFMNAPTISMPQDDDGYWMPGPLLYPDNPEELGLTIYKSFDGYYLEPRTGQIRLMLTRWMPGDKPDDRLFTHDDLLALIKGGVGRAVFSLDSNSVYRKYDPLQVVRFAPSALEGTEYARCLFETDYLMKIWSQGQQISGEVPYNTRPVEPFLEGVPEHVKRKILILAENAPKENNKSQTTRFWIEMGSIPRSQTEKGYGVFIHYGDPMVEVKKQLMQISASGELEDAVINVDDQSREAQFARGLTEHYKEIGDAYPVFRQLKEFYKISGAINELQVTRLRNTDDMKVAQNQLDDAHHWVQVAAEKRKEWTDNLNSSEYWDARLQEKRDSLNRIVKSDAHWERKTESQVPALEEIRDGLTQEKGEQYEQVRAALLEEHGSLIKEIYTHKPELMWTVTHPDFIQHMAVVRHQIMSAILVDHPTLPQEAQDSLFELFVNGKKEFSSAPEALLHSLKSSVKDEMTEAFVSLNEVMGTKPYQAASALFMQGDLNKMASMQAEFEMAKLLATDETSPQMTQFWQISRTTILADIRQELDKKIRDDVPGIRLIAPGNPVIHFTKQAYVHTDAEFLLYYSAQRSSKKQELVDNIKPQVPNWAQNEAQYLAELDTHLEQNFSQQSQLTRFNQIVTEYRSEKKNEWVVEFISKNKKILEQFNGDQIAYEDAVEALLNGDREPFTQAQTNMLMSEIQELLKKNLAHQTPHSQKAWNQLFECEKAVQLSKMQDVFKSIQALPKDQQKCPDYGHLITYFAEHAYKKAIDAFMQGNAGLLIEGKIARALDEVKKAFSVDLYPQAKAIVDGMRANLEKNIETTSKDYVDQLKASLTQNMEAQVARYVDEAQDSLKDDIKTGNQLESTLLSIELGPMEKESVPPNTKYRVPAIFTHKDNGYVYGGVCARVSYQVVIKIDHVIGSLQCSFDSTRERNISMAKNALRDLTWNISTSNLLSRDLSVQFAESCLRREIMSAERAQIQSEQLQQQQQKKMTFFKSAESYFKTEIQQTTFKQLANTPETPAKSLFFWRAVESVNNTLHAAQEFSSVLHRATHLIKDVSPGMGCIAEQLVVAPFDLAVYGASITKGVIQGAGDAAHLVGHLYDGLIEPTALLAWDSVVIAAYHLPMTNYNAAFSDPGEAALWQMQMMIRQNSTVYQSSYERMQQRGNDFSAAVHSVQEANGFERARMASRLITNIAIVHKAMHQAGHAAGHLKTKATSVWKKNQNVLQNTGESIAVSATLQATIAELSKAAGLIDEGVGFIKKTGKILHVPMEITDKMNAFKEATENEDSEHHHHAPSH